MVSTKVDTYQSRMRFRQIAGDCHGVLAASRSTPCVDESQSESKVSKCARKASTHGVDLPCRPRSTPTRARCGADRSLGTVTGSRRPVDPRHAWMNLNRNRKFRSALAKQPRMAWIYRVEQGRHLPEQDAVPTDRGDCHRFPATSRFTPCVDESQSESEVSKCVRKASTHGVDLLCRPRSTPTRARCGSERSRGLSRVPGGQ